MSRLRRSGVPLIAAAALLFGFAMPAAASPDGIDGFITNARTGEPLVNVQVIAYELDGSWVSDAFTDETGHYEIAGLIPGQYRIFSHASEMVEQWAFGKVNSWEADPVTSPGTASLALAPIEYGSLSGRFVAPSGAPVANALVQVYTTDQNQRDSTQTATDGSFRFDHLRTGGYKLRFTTPGGGVQWAHQVEEFLFEDAETFVVAANQDTAMTEVAFPTGGLEVLVVDTDTAEPIADACVSWRNGPQQIFDCTDASGKAVFENIRTGTYSVSVSPPDGYLYGSMDEIVVSADQTTAATTELTKASEFTISIVDSATGQSAANSCVSVAEEKQGGVVSGSLHCTSTGEISLEQFPAGRWRIFAFTNDASLGAQWVGPRGGVGDVRRAKLFTTTSGATTDVSIKLDRAGAISGMVRSAADGKAVEGLCPSVTPVMPGGHEPYNTVCSQADGRYTIRGLGPYRWPVEFPDLSGKHAWMWSGNAADRLAATMIPVRPGATATADIRLPLAGTVTGTVLGATLPNEYISVVAVNTRTGDYAGPMALVRGATEYRLTGLATQQIWIDYTGTPADMTRYPDPVAVVAGQTARLDLPARS